MDPTQWRSANKAPFDIISYAWAEALHKQVHAGALTLEQAATIMEDASVVTWDKLSDFHGALTSNGVTRAEGSITNAIGDGQDPEGYVEDPSPAGFAQPCFESLAVLMGLSVEDLTKLTDGPASPKYEGQGDEPQGPAQPVAAPPTPPARDREDNNYSGA